MQIYFQNITSDKGSPKYKSSVLRSYSSPFEHSKTRNAAFPIDMTTQKLHASNDVTSQSKPIGEDGVRRSLSKTNSHPKLRSIDSEQIIHCKSHLWFKRETFLFLNCSYGQFQQVRCILAQI